jgi:hypothetical protein
VPVTAEAVRSTTAITAKDTCPLRSFRKADGLTTRLPLKTVLPIMTFPIGRTCCEV